MALVHQQNGLDFFIEPDFPAAPHVRITKGNAFAIIRIGIPEHELPYIEKYENISREDLVLAYNPILASQANFLSAWPKIHSVPTPL